MRLLLCALLVAWAIPPCTAGDAVNDFPPDSSRAAERALKWLAAKQRADGAWEIGDQEGGPDVAVTSLVGMAFLSAGHVPGRGPYGDNVSRAVQYVLSCARRNGDMSGKHSTMYGHGFGMLFLSEVYGTSDDPEIGRKLRAAVTLALSAQKTDGGWRYDPSPAGPSDLSVTVCQIVALRAAHNAGVNVAKSSIDKAMTFVRKSAWGDGSFRYMLASKEGGSLAMTAAGITALYWAGDYSAPEIARGLVRLRLTGNMDVGDEHFFYTHYYVAQAMFQAGGEHWAAYFPTAREALLAAQAPDGSWTSPEGAPYATAMAAIVLQVPRQYLPIFQR